MEALQRELQEVRGHRVFFFLNERRRIHGSVGGNNETVPDI